MLNEFTLARLGQHGVGPGWNRGGSPILNGGATAATPLGTPVLPASLSSWLGGLLGTSSFFSFAQAAPLASAQAAAASADPLQPATLSAGLASMKSGPLAALDSHLAALYLQQGPNAAAMAPFTSTVRQLDGALVRDTHGAQYVIVDVTAKDGNGAALLTQLKALGLQHGSSYGALASGALPVNQLGALLHVGDLGHASESAATTNAGLVTTQADAAQYADAARYTYGVDGTGVKVGILSDSFNKSGSTYPAILGGGVDNTAADKAAGDLPSSVTVLQDYVGGEDEGRAMGQLVHDLAPGSPILFATAFVGGQAGMANNIIALANSGAKVIVDDVTYFAEPAYQDGVIAQAISQVVNTKGVVYFTSAANNGDNGWEGTWLSGSTGNFNGLTETFMKFGSGAAGKEYLTVTLGSSQYFVLQWDNPAASAGGPGATTDLDIELTNAAGTVVYASSMSSNIGGDPVEVMSVGAMPAGTYYLRVGLASGPAPTEIKVMALGNGSGVTLGTSGRNTNNGTVYGHAASADAIAVAAAGYFSTPAYGSTPAQVEDFSSGGSTTIWYDAAGNRLASPEIRHNPQIAAVDGGDTTFFGQDAEANGLPNFFGTSAAAPDAAAVAALMLQARAGLTRGDILNLLQDSATDMDDPSTAGFDVGFDNRTGSGLIRANLAVGFAQTLVITADPAHGGVLNGTHLADTFWGATTGSGGDGNDRFNYNANFLASFHLDGGPGADTLSLNGTYTGAHALAFTATTMVNIESILLGAMGTGYAITTNDANVAAGQTLTVNGAGLTAAMPLTFSAVAETNGVIVVTGGAGADTLKTGAGADTLTGGAGKDTLTGGGGNDTFVFKALADSKTASPDLIADFSSGDKIDLHLIDADTGTALDQAFHIGGGGGHAGDVMISFDSVNNRTVVDLYVDNNASIDATIWLTGNIALATGDFTL